MEKKKFVVLNRARKYFAATQKGYKCKILIDLNSENLELGEQELLVDDISVKSKYGTDYIYKLAGEAVEQKTGGICTLKHRYNSDLVDECRNLAGQWDAIQKVWVFSAIVQDKVDELDEIYNSEEIVVEIQALNDFEKRKKPVDFCGYPVARATGRDSGAKIGDDVALIEGSISSSGSFVNWCTYVKKDTIFRLSVPEKNLDQWITHESGLWKITRL